MAREKKPVHKVQMAEGKRNIIRQLLEEDDIQTAEDIQETLKDLLGGTIKEMMETEMDVTISAIKNPGVPTVMITVTAIKANGSTAAMAAWISKCHKTASLHLNRRWSRSAKRYL